jgi:DNA polymerase-3 subunit gamma/tau
MFENVLGQPAAQRLRDDIKTGRLAPAMLFAGPPASGKGTSALELARSLSCEKQGDWNCPCSSCVRQRTLSHPDLLLLGFRLFFPEIAAAGAGFLRDQENAAVKTLFIRSIRKLLNRFSPILWEDDSKLGKLGSAIISIEEDLDDIEREKDPGRLQKLCASLIKNSLKLEEDGITETIPISHIRRAASWARTATPGRGKFIIIENADKMQEGARNSLLKILEEPPASLKVVLTTVFKGAVLPTIQSRLRPYHFVKRDAETEQEVIRRVFRDSGAADSSGAGGIAAYLDSFLPVPDEKLRAAAALFAASVFRCAAVGLKRKGGTLPEELIRLGVYTSAVAEAAGLGKPLENSRALISFILGETDSFKGRCFPRFLKALLTLISEVFKTENVSGGAPASGEINRLIAYNDIWRKQTEAASVSLGLWNQNPGLSLEGLFVSLKEAMVEAG